MPERFSTMTSMIALKNLNLPLDKLQEIFGEENRIANKEYSKKNTSEIWVHSEFRSKNIEC